MLTNFLIRQVVPGMAMAIAIAASASRPGVVWAEDAASGAAVAGGAAADAAAAGPTTAELLARIEALEKALAEVRRDAGRCDDAAAAQPSPMPPRSGGVVAVRRAPSPGGAVAEAAPGEPSADAKAAPVTAGYKDGFFLASADGAYKLKLGGYAQADSRFFVDDGPDDNVDNFLIRRARIDMRATLAKRFNFRLTPDFAGSRISLQEASIEAKFAPWMVVRAGKFKTPFGLERLQSSSDLLFIERALTDNLVPGRDVGIQVSGDVRGEEWSYEFAVLNGVPDGTSGDTDVNDAVDVAARVFAKPFVNSMYSPLRGAGVGVAGMWGRQHGSGSSSQLPDFETSLGRSTFFEYDDDAFADGDRWRVSPQAAWYEGQFGMLAEYVVSSQQVGNDVERAWVANEAWQARASWVLTGEDASYEAIVPEKPFDFGGGHWGAWETGLRWTALDVDGDAFSHGFADAGESARHADAIALAVKWYLNRNIGVFVNYEHTDFGGGDDTGDRKDEDVFVTRMQVIF